MAFGFRKKNKTANETPAEETAVRVPMTLIFDTENADAENAAALFSALPENAQILAFADEDTPLPPPPEGRTLLRCRTRGAQVKGDFVVEADGTQRFDAEKAEALFGAVVAAQADVVFFGANEQKRGAGTGDSLQRVLRGERPLPLHTAVLKSVAAKADSFGLAKKHREVFIPLLFAESAQSIPVDPFLPGKDTPHEETSEEVFTLCAYFNKVKSSLVPDRYRFAFNYVCDELIRSAAKLGAAGDANGLTEFDARLKGMNMALWVAAAEKSPLSFMRKLRKNNYNVSFPLKTFLKAYIARKR